MTFKIGDKLINKDGHELEILARWSSYDSEGISYDDNNDYFICRTPEGSMKALTEKQLIEKGYEPKLYFDCLKKEKVWPSNGDKYWLVSDAGIVYDSTWDDMEVDRYRLSIGNCHRIREGAEAYRDSLKPKVFRNHL